MSQVWTITSREFWGYFRSLTAYFFIVLFVGTVNFIFIWFSLLGGGQAEMRMFFEFAIYGLWLFVPAITMRSWAEEKKLGTDELLLTLPIRDWEAVLGKYFAGVIFIAVSLALTFMVPLSVSRLGDPDWGPIITGYLGLLLLGSALLAMGVAVSSMTENQFIAFLITLLAGLAFLAVEELFSFLALPGLVGFLVQYLDMGHHFDSIGRGVVDTRDVIYYLSVIAFFIFLNIRSVESRKWL